MGPQELLDAETKAKEEMRQRHSAAGDSIGEPATCPDFFEQVFSWRPGGSEFKSSGYAGSSLCVHLPQVTFWEPFFFEPPPGESCVS